MRATIHFTATPPERVSAAPSPLVEDGLAIWLDGRLDNRRDLLRLRAGGPDDDASDAALVLAAYRAVGDRFASILLGDFAIALLDPARRALLLTRDIMAARPLFYARVREGVAFASDTPFLLGQPEVGTKLDLDGLADLVLNGYSDVQRTCFEKVCSVPPGGLVTVRPDGATVTRAWDFPERQVRYSRFEDYVAHFGMLFTQAVQRRLRGPQPIGIAVSGGLDSSTIYCEAARLCGSAALFGMRLAYPPNTPADETPFVDALRRNGLPVHDVAVDRVTWQVDPETAPVSDVPVLAWQEYERLLDRARQAGCRVLISGFYGDQLLTGDAYLLDAARRGRFNLMRRHIAETAAWMSDVDPAVLRRRVVRAALRGVAPARVLRTIRRLRGVPANYPSWFCRSFRERAFEATIARAGRRRRFSTAHGEECRQLATSGHYLSGLLRSGGIGRKHQLDTVYPFRDRDLVEFVMSIPGDVVNHNGVPKALLRSAGQGLVPEAIRLRRTKGDATAFSNRAARSAEPAVRRLLGADSIAAQAGLLDPDALHARLPELVGTGLMRDDSAQLGWDLGDTLAMELWLRHFFAGGSWN